MRTSMIRTIALAGLVTLAVVGGTYGFSRYAHAQSLAPASLEVEADQQSASAWLGLHVVPLNERTAAQLGIQQQTGIAVARVLPNGPAAAAGVQVKDIITAINRVPVDSLPALRTELTKVTAGDQVTLTVQRGSSSEQLTITTSTAPAATPRQPRHEGGALPLFKALGPLSGGQSFENSLGGQFSYKDASGQVVTVKADFGVVKTATDGSVTVTLNRGGDVPFTISGTTRMRGKGSDLQAGDRVVAMTRENSNELVGLLRVRHVEKRTDRDGTKPKGERANPGQPGTQGGKQGAPDGRRVLALPAPMMEGLDHPLTGHPMGPHLWGGWAEGPVEQLIH